MKNTACNISEIPITMNDTALRTGPEVLPADDAMNHEWRLLQVYLYYRLLLALSLLAAYFFTENRSTSASQDQPLYFATIATYVVLAIMSLLTARLRTGRLGIQVFIIIVTDILVIGILEYAKGETSSNLTVLLVVTVAAGSILVQGKLATFFAAIATLVVLYKQGYSAFMKGAFSQDDLVQSALIGITCFATSILAQQIAHRLRESAELAGRQAKDLANLEELNHHIIQRMRTGILVVNGHNEILLINDACWKMFGMPRMSENTRLENISPELSQQLSQWRANPFVRNRPFRTSSSGPEVQVNFTSLDTGDGNNALIFVDDNIRMAQQAQQLKLASLGGLTASIAHEIRNPLGAISHAAQLLQESPQLGEEDRRLTEIIRGNAVRISRIIDNVLQFSRRGTSKPERLELPGYLGQFAAEFGATLQLPEGALRIAQDADSAPSSDAPHVRADPTQLQQILWNLCQNAIAHAGAEGQPVELLYGRLPSNNRPYVEVADRGPGIAPEDAERIFEPFFTRSTRGTGLGLFLARELAQTNGATLLYEPRTGGGSVFRIVFTDPDRWETAA